MKKIILILGLLFFVTSIKSQTLTQKWNTDFTWGGTDDQVTKIILKSSGLYINGWRSGNATTNSAVAKFNTLGDSIWKKSDTVTSSLSDIQFCVLENIDKIFYLSSGSANKYLVIRNKNTGATERIMKLESRMSFCEYGDSVIAVTSQNPARVKIFSQNGDTTRSFSLGYPLNQGYVTVKNKGNDVWIFGLYYASQYNSFVEKRNMITGQLLWRQNFLSSNQNYADLDSLGNAYIGLNYLTGNQDSLIKLDANGNRVFQRILSPIQPIGIWDMTIDSKNQHVILVGSATNMVSGKTVGWVAARNMQSGDSVFTFEVVWNANHNSNAVKGITCDTSGNFYITGQSYTGPITDHVRKYYFDALTNIKVIGNGSPEKYSLSQNYPNPFNPTTKIRFSIVNGFPARTSGNDKVVLKVYDLQGRELQTLVNESLKPGTYEVNFDGAKLTSGVYFYKLITDSYSETKKMCLIK